MSSKELQEVINSVVDALPDASPPEEDAKVILEALGRVAAVFLAQYPDAEFEVWLKAVRDTRSYVRKHGALQ